MGKNVPLRIGRKSKRELNPVERMRKKEKHKKNIKQFLKKINQKENGEFKSKLKPRRSPSPETNDPMVKELISASSLRLPVIPSAAQVMELPVAVPQVILKANPKTFIPTVLNKKQEIIQSPSIDSSDSDSDSDLLSHKPIHPPPSKPSQNQSLYKTLLESDPKLTDFFNSIRDII